MKNYEAYYYDIITKSPHLLTGVDVVYSSDVENFVYWQRAMVEYPMLLEDMKNDRIVSWYNHLGKLQEGFQTNSVSFTLTALRILRQILEVMPNETMLNLAPTIFEIIKQSHPNKDVIQEALQLYAILSAAAYDLRVYHVNFQIFQLLIDRLKGSQYTTNMRFVVLVILTFASSECLEELSRQRQFLYNQFMDTFKAFNDKNIDESRLFKSWAATVSQIMGIPRLMMTQYLSMISSFAEKGVKWEYLKSLIDAVEEVGRSGTNSLGNIEDVLFLTQGFKQPDPILQCISIFKMDTNQLQQKHALIFLELMKSEKESVAVKAKDILLNKFPIPFKINQESLFQIFVPLITDEGDMMFFLKNVNVQLITVDQAKLIFEKLPKMPITKFQDVLSFFQAVPNHVQQALSKSKNLDFALNYLDALHKQNKDFIIEGYQLLITKYLSLSNLNQEQARAFILRLKVIHNQQLYFALKMIFRTLQTPQRAAEILKDIETPTSALAKIFTHSKIASLLSEPDYFSLTDTFLNCLIDKANSEPLFESTYFIPDSINTYRFSDSILIDVFETAISSPYIEWRIFAVSLANKFIDDYRMQIQAQSVYEKLVDNLGSCLGPVTEISLKTSGKQDILQERLMEFSTLIMSLLVDLRSNWDEFKKIDISLLMADFPSLVQRKAIKDETMDYSKLFSSYLDLIEMELNTNAELSHIDTLPQLILEVPMSTSIQDDVILKAIQISAKLIGSSSNEDAAKLLINILESKINDPSEVAEHAITSLQETHSIATLSQVEVDRLLKIASKADGELRVEQILLALLEDKGLTLPAVSLYKIIQVAEKLNSEKVHQILIEEIRLPLAEYENDEKIDAKSVLGLIAYKFRKDDHEIKGNIIPAVINVLKASNWDLEISVMGLRIVQNESTSDAQMGQEFISLMQSLETLEDERKIEIMALGMQILQASFNNFKDSITNDQVQFIDRTVAAAQSLNISNIMEKYQENVLSPTPSIDIADEPTASTNSAAIASTSMGINTETSTTTAGKSDENPSEDSKETEERFDMLTRFKNIIIVKGKEILAEFIKPITSTLLLGPTISTQNFVVIAPSVVFTSALEVTKESKLHLGIAVGVPVGIIAFLATSFVLVRKCRKNKNSIAG